MSIPRFGGDLWPTGVRVQYSPAQKVLLILPQELLDGGTSRLMGTDVKNEGLQGRARTVFQERDLGNFRHSTEIPVHATQLVVGTFRLQPTILEKEQAVASTNRAKAVGNHYDRPVAL